MTEVDQYESWDAREYLKQYYATREIPDDSRALLAFLEQKTDRKHFMSAIDFGCGPTLYTAFVVAPHVQSLSFADHRRDNIAEIELWITGHSEAFDWTNYVNFALQLEGLVPSTAQVQSRVEEVRLKSSELLIADIRASDPLGTERTFDLVVSLFCIESVGEDFCRWATYLKRLAAIVAPGGRLVLASMLGCTGYQVLGRRFPATAVNEGDLAAELAECGFDANTIEVTALQVSDWSAEGFDRIGLACADKASV